MKIDYDHSRNLHTAEGARAAFRTLREAHQPRSVLDVGCGKGTWLRAALDSGVRDVVGVDGVQIPADELLIPADAFRCFDLRHLEQSHADTLTATLVRHSDQIIFSAACPGQPGQHHVNCKWPEWWQSRFNALGYTCNDEIRSKLWNEPTLEPWYRQNIFTAKKDPGRARSEPLLKSLIHPEMLPYLISCSAREAAVKNIEKGCMPASWYLETSGKVLYSKFKRRTLPRHS
jgi:hypothetical protein